jgi:glucose/arabinose dehydrogenase/PKD repeat protein
MAILKGIGRTSRLSRVSAVGGAAILAAILLVLVRPYSANAVSTLPAGFRESVVFSGLANPTNAEFSQDGRVFVAEKSGLIKVFDNLSDATPITFADLRTNVHNFWDRGLLGLALDPNFPASPYVYVLYTYDAQIGGTAPRWGSPGVTSDSCPTPPGATADGCVVSGRLSRLRVDPNTNTMTGSEQVLIEDWCQQYPSHTVGSLVFGSDGALYVSGGDGASFNFADYGQDGNPLNPCGDPPGEPGTLLAPPTAEGGALRSQDLRTSGDPVGLSGSILRVDPATGNALPENPLISNSDPNARRIIAHGLRNPFRQTLVARPGTDEIWVGDVGWGRWEEINRIANPTDSNVENFGWPCYEGHGRQSGYDGQNLDICENLYGQANAVSAPYFTYQHGTQVAGENCATGNGSSITGLAFYKGGPYPDEYDDALFFADHARRCIWVMQKGTNGLPNPGQLKPFVTDAENPVDLEIGPNGDLFYVALNGTIRRIQYASANQPPIARATANPTGGAVPLTVSLDGSGSSDPDGETLTYEWDIDGDGAFDDSTSSQPTYTYDTTGDYQVGLRVTDSQGASDTLDQPLTISAGNTAPTATIDSPSSTTTWKVGDNISFSGSATDQQDGSLAASSLTWSLIMHHCSSQSSCHEHQVQDFAGVASGSFVAPDHEYPSYLELRLTANDSGGLTHTRSLRLDPETVELSFGSDPAGLQLTVGSASGTTPFSRTVIVGSNNSISATSPQVLGGTTHEFASWSDGSAQSHDIVAPATATTYTAVYTPVTTGLKGEYYDNQDLTNLKLARADPKVDFSWGSGSPDPSIAPDTFSVRWSGQVKADHTETYTFYGSTNDGVRLWVDGQQIINRWSNGLATNTGTIALQAGQWYPITMEYYEGTNTASAKLEYSSPSTLRQVVPTDHLRPEAPPDTTAPTVSSVAPQDGAAGVAVGTNVETTFSEAMDASTIMDGSNTFILTRQGATTPVAATVSYDGASKKATLNPSANLEAGATYAATIKGGAGGVEDLAGNPLGADMTWVFMTAAAPPPDTTPPDTTINSGPSGTIKQASASFTFSSSEANSTFECSLDSGAFSTCSSPKKYTGLANGSHTFRVKAKDAAGNIDVTPASRAWTVRR